MKTQRLESKIFAECIFFPVLFFTVVSFTGCSNRTAKAEQEAYFAVTTYKTTTGRLDDYLEFGGDVVASSVVNVMPDTSGKISRIFVSVGDLVRKDQVLAYLDPSRPGMTYSASPVKAPVSGTVTSFPLSLGETAGPNSPIGQISSTEKLEIQTSVAERFISRIRNGQNAVVTFDAYPGEKFSARVFEISPVLDTSTRTLKIKLRLSPPDDRIKAGMYARVRLITEQLNNAIIIPYDAMVSRDGGQYVFTVTRPGESAGTGNDTPAAGKTAAGEEPPSTVHLTGVKPGIHVDDKVEITSGLKVGDEIVIRGQTLLNDGSKGNIITAENAGK